MTNIALKSVTTPEQFAEELRSLFADTDWPEYAHREADDLLCSMLEQLGYGEGVQIFQKAEKWYA